MSMENRDERRSSVQRRRSERAITNDHAIRSAAVDEVLRVGVDRVSLREVGLRAGLTHGASYARYEDVDELLVDLWNARLRSRVVSMLDAAKTAAERPSAVTVERVTDLVRNASAEDVCAVHLLLASRRIPVLHEELSPFLDANLSGEPRGSLVGDATSTRGLAVFSMIITRVMGDYHFRRDDASLSTISEILLETLSSDPAALAFGEPREPASPFIMPEGDDLRTQLAAATIQVVGRSGYTNATMSRIARRAACSPGAIYKIFSSKEDLVASAFVSSMKSRWMPLSEFTEILGPGTLAQYLSDISNPANTPERNFLVEFALAAMTNETIEAAMLAHQRELLAVLPHLKLATEEEKSLLGHMIRLFSHLTMGTTMLATLSPSRPASNFSQFTEPFRAAVLRRAEPSWSQLCKHLVWYDQTHGAAQDELTPTSPPWTPSPRDG